VICRIILGVMGRRSVAAHAVYKWFPDEAYAAHRHSVARLRRDLAVRR
jgi:hypothetical protein